MNIIIYAGICLLVLVVWVFLGKLFFELINKKEQKKREEAITKDRELMLKEREILEKDKIEIIKKAEIRADKIEKDAQSDIDRKQAKLDRLEEIYLAKEEKLNIRVEKKLEELEIRKQNYKDKLEEIEEIKKEQLIKLSEISWLTKEEAKELVMKQIEEQNSHEIERFMEKFKHVKEEEAAKEWAEILARVLPRISMDEVSSFTISLVELEDDNLKWKIIGKEWRNIGYFEKLTWVELVIDDTPLVVKVSSFDPERRFIATETLRRLLKDWRINPVYVEKIYNEILESFDEIMIQKWKDALSELNLPMMKPDIVRMIWKFYLRYSYGQNLLLHSMEVAKIAEILANELWLDWMLAKKAWILHDIWKIVAESWEWHAKVWWDILRKYWFGDIVVNAAEWHHFDIPLISPIWWIVAAADSLSASRPWARFNNKELFIERMKTLENLITSIDWVDKVYIMQAWREIMAFVNPEIISDLELQKLIKTIWEKIEWEMDYPWMVRVAAIRENKVVDFLN